MNLRRILLGTKNARKLAELRDILARAKVDVTVVPLDEVRGDLAAPEETGTTFEENAKLKALHYARKTGLVALADDSGLEVDALGGAPGVHSARFAGEDATDEENNRKLLAALEGVPEVMRTARFRCVIALADPDGVALTTSGTVEGRILEEPSGEGGFGYDPLFFHEPFACTFAEVDAARKADVSHRGQALRRLARELPGVLTILENRRNF